MKNEPYEGYDEKIKVLEHFGYDAHMYERFGGIQILDRKIFDEETPLKSFHYYEGMRGYKRYRAILNYDPDFPRVYFRIERMK